MRSVVRASMVTVAAGVAALTIAACGAGAANGPAPAVQPANSTFSTDVPTTVVVPPPRSAFTTNPAPGAPAVPTTRGRGVEPGDDNGGNCALEPGDDRCARAGAGGAVTTRGSEAEPGDDRGGNCALEPNDDRCLRAGEPGDDHGDRATEPGDDHGGDSHGGRGRGGDGGGDDGGGHGGHHDG